MGHFVFLMFSYSQKNEKIALFHFKGEKKSDLTKLTQQRDNPNYSFTVSYLKNIIPRNFITKSKTLIDPNQRFIAISNKWRYIEHQRERIAWKTQYQ